MDTRQRLLGLLGAVVIGIAMFGTPAAVDAATCTSGEHIKEATTNSGK